VAAKDDLIERIELGVRQVIALSILFNYEVAEQTGLNARDNQVMGLVQIHGPLTAGQIARLANLPSGTVTGVVDRLEALGFVHRERDPQDRRKVIVRVDDEKVWRELGHHYAPQSARLRELLAGYDQRKLKIVADFLTEVVATQAGHGEVGRS
jgi:DNA-binding MarR family transcriptional regulator